MALNFTETAPGVHTTTLTNPKTEQRHNIAIIESCDAWQLFVDGELAARDLPSFKAAITEAEAKITTRRTTGHGTRCVHPRGAERGRCLGGRHDQAVAVPRR